MTIYSQLAVTSERSPSCPASRCGVDASQPPAKLGLVFRSAPRPFIVSQPLWATWCLRLIAALRSRSMTSPQCSQRNTRVDRDSLGFTAPQSEHVFDEA